MTGTPPLSGSSRVIDLSAGIAGAYCTKILADAGADVIKVEPPEGDPLRRRSASGEPVSPEEGGPLFQYLSGSKSSVVADPSEPADLALVLDLVRDSDAVVWSAGGPFCAMAALHPHRLRAHAPAAVIATITPFGLDHPWRHVPANQFTLQAMSGGVWQRGSPDRPPITVGGEHGDFVAGTVAALGLLIGRWRARGTGMGELVDVAVFDALQLTQAIFPVTLYDLTGRPHGGRRESIPAIHRTKDGGFVGIWVTTGQQWLDFCSLLGRMDWAEDQALGTMENRARRRRELVDDIDAWAGDRTTEEIVELASLLRVPVAPVATGATLPTLDHFVERQWFKPNPRTGVTQPDVWYSMSGGAERRPPGLSPLLGQDTARLRAAVPRARPAHPTPAGTPPAATRTAAQPLPFEGLRIADFTAFWAGPIITHVFAMLGADVIHIESTNRPDGIRMAATIPMSQEGWWETSAFFNGTNTNKRDFAVDLQSSKGREVALRLVEQCDIVVENFSPRVMPQLGLDYDALRTVQPDIIMVRAPGFGTSGPWADRVAYAPTIDQASGLSWVTGFPDSAPGQPTAPADPLGGLHAAVAILLALEHRKRTGRGMLLESPQVGGGICTNAEPVVEWSANGTLLGRVGNRSWVVAPQGLYQVADGAPVAPDVPTDAWVAISVEDDQQWRGLCRVLDDDAIANDPNLERVEGRRAEHDRIDAAISSWCRSQRGGDVVEQLVDVGVPASQVVPPTQIADVEPAQARGLYETVHHPVAGSMRIIGFPARFSGGPDCWHRAPAPCLGEHNREILEDLLGYTPAEVDELAEEGVIGTRTGINLGW
jgi:crotonobetainyl-CoA:carnitine CoA-transferase CaiB-like acyl-CoA transferase